MKSSWYCLILFYFLVFAILFSPKYQENDFSASYEAQLYIPAFDPQTAEPYHISDGAFGLVMELPQVLTSAGLEVCSHLGIVGIVKLNLFQLPGKNFMHVNTGFFVRPMGTILKGIPFKGGGFSDPYSNYLFLFNPF
jgi:hypothetical protein